MRSHFKKLIPSLLFPLILLSGCSGHLPEVVSKENAPIELNVKQNGNELLKEHPELFTVSGGNTSLRFFNANWDNDARGTVIIGQPGHTVVLHYVSGVMGKENSAFTSERITDWKIATGIAQTRLIDHDEARRRFFGILQSFLDAGWVRAIPLGDPRLRGEAALHYLKTQSPTYTLDPAYVLPLDEWMALKDRTTWSLYADRAYLDISITRERSRNDIDKPGAYLIFYSFRSEDDRLRAMIDPMKRLYWRSELANVINAQKKLRNQAEDALKKENVAIDESYRDPPITGFSD
ncbi:hypothetical protein [Herbaspirillum seropedicae]|uniref:hypothetical protein n=1 Tax=Herbaspirillum seropedicae TaxID=964 RepID=UPI001FD46F6E|nr:hypothetical protein [Herbaspirillum seropedicae]